jgi:hypothetical protein
MALDQLEERCNLGVGACATCRGSDGRDLRETLCAEGRADEGNRHHHVIKGRDLSATRPIERELGRVRRIWILVWATGTSEDGRYVDHG